MKQYEIILADPPWRYSQKGGAGSGRTSLRHHEHGGFMLTAYQPFCCAGLRAFSLEYIPTASRSTASDSCMGIHL